MRGKSPLFSFARAFSQESPLYPTPCPPPDEELDADQQPVPADEKKKQAELREQWRASQVLSSSSKNISEEAVDNLDEEGARRLVALWAKAFGLKDADVYSPQWLKDNTGETDIRKAAKSVAKHQRAIREKDKGIMATINKGRRGNATPEERRAALLEANKLLFGNDTSKYKGDLSLFSNANWMTIRVNYDNRIRTMSQIARGDITREELATKAVQDVLAQNKKEKMRRHWRIFQAAIVILSAFITYKGAKLFFAKRERNRRGEAKWSFNGKVRTKDAPRPWRTIVFSIASAFGVAIALIAIFTALG